LFVSYNYSPFLSKYYDFQNPELSRIISHINLLEDVEMKKLCAILVILLALGSFAFAGGGQQGGGGGAAASPALIGIAMPETHVLRWTKDGASLKSYAEARGYRALDQYANADQNLQNTQIQNFLTQGAKAIIISCVNDGVGAVVAEAARDSVAVIAYDRIIPNSADYDYFITFNNFKVGEFQGQGIEAGLNLKSATAANPKYITLFAGSPTDGNAFFFYDGAMSVLNPYIKSGVLKVVGPYPETSADTANFQRIATENWQAPIAKTRMENLLNNDARNVTLDAVLAPNDTLARAIIEACLADAKYAGGKLPVVTGQDAEFDSAVSIKNGQQYMTVFKDTAKLAEAAVLLADQVLKGQTPNIPGATLASGSLASIGDTGRKVVKTYLLEPISVTSSNINVPVDAGFYTDAEAAQLR
jgi:putative multiple sugar transport system substrate-binding protein